MKNEELTIAGMFWKVWEINSKIAKIFDSLRWIFTMIALIFVAR